MQGKSLRTILEDPSAPWRDAIYYHYCEYPNIHNVPPHEGVRTDRYKLINFYRHDGFNLFDLETDPHEMTDLSRNPDYAEILLQMKGRLAELRARYGVPPLDSETE